MDDLARVLATQARAMFGALLCYWLRIALERTMPEITRDDQIEMLESIVRGVSREAEELLALDTPGARIARGFVAMKFWAGIWSRYQETMLLVSQFNAEQAR